MGEVFADDPLNSRWWFQIFFPFPTWGDDPIWRAYFSVGLVQPPTRLTNDNGKATMNEDVSSLWKKNRWFSSVMLVLWGVSKIVGPYHGFALLSETVKFLMFENLRHPARGLVFKVCFDGANTKPQFRSLDVYDVYRGNHIQRYHLRKKKNLRKLRRSYFWLEDFVEFEAFVPPFLLGWSPWTCKHGEVWHCIWYLLAAVCDHISHRGVWWQRLGCVFF